MEGKKKSELDSGRAKTTTPYDSRPGSRIGSRKIPCPEIESRKNSMSWVKVPLINFTEPIIYCDFFYREEIYLLLTFHLPDPVNKEQGYCHIWFSYLFSINTYFLDFL